MKPTDIVSTDGKCHYYESFLTNNEADKYLNLFRTNIKWSKRKIKIFGKLVEQPRLVAWYGEPEAVYTYSQTTFQPIEWTKELSEIKSKVEDCLQSKFNGLLMNFYRDGNDYMGYHSDNEPELGHNPIIASLSLGATRRFHLKHNTQKELKTSVDLAHGSLLVMSGEMQLNWKHMVSKTKRSHNPRINLTFRLIK